MSRFRRRRRGDDDFAAEIEAHLQSEIDQLVAEGLSPAEARVAARRAFGNVTLTRERFHESRRIAWIEDLRRDVEYATRHLAANPLFTLTAILTLTLGIAATTTAFSLIDAVLLRPLPYPAIDRLVRINQDVTTEASAGTEIVPVGLSKAEVDLLRHASFSLSEIGSYLPTTMTLTGAGDPVRLHGMQVSPDVIAMLGVPAARGRIFTSNEDSPADHVVILSDRMWRRQFSSDPHVLGAPIALDGTSCIVVGIMPPHFAFPDSGTLFWIPLVWPAQGARLVATARLRDGFSVTTAAEEISDILYQYRREHALPVPPPPPPPPKDPAELSKMLDAFAHQQPASGEFARRQRTTLEVERPRVRLVGFQEFLLGSSRPAMLVISAAVACVLLLACVNLAGLLLARAATRQREIAVRLALGASRARLVKQLLTETGLLSLSGAALGLALTVVAVRGLRALGLAPHHAGFAPAFGLPRFDEVTVNASVFIFAAATSLVSGLAAAVIPALTLTRRAENDRLRDECAASSGWRLDGRRRTHGVLVAGQIAMATMLSVAALQLIRSYDALSRVDLGYQPEGVLTFQVVTPQGRPHGTLRDDLIARLQVLPGVRFASVANLLPTEGSLGSVALRTSANASSGAPPPPGPAGSSRPEFPSLCIVGHDYFNVMGIRVLEGRGFTLTDRAGAPRVMVVNRALAQTGYLGADPIGRLVYVMGSEPWRIIGVVDDVRQFGPTQNPGPQVFVPIEQSSGSTSASRPVALSGAFATLPSFVVRTSGNPERAVPLMRDVVKRVDPAAAIDNVETMNHLVSNTVVRPRVYAVTLGAFAGAAALLAIIGICGLIAYVVRHRTHEIGIRMALGADRRTILSLVLGQGVVLIWLGILFGTGAALATSGMLRGMLFGVAPFDPLSYGVAAVGFAIVALGGCYIPARRAMSVDPLVALRHE